MAPPYEDLIADFHNDGTSFYLNTTDDVPAFEAEWAPDVGEDYPGCSDNEKPTTATDASIDAFSPASAYPDSYNSQVAQWAQDLATSPDYAVPINGSPNWVAAKRDFNYTALEQPSPSPRHWAFAPWL